MQTILTASFISSGVASTMGIVLANSASSETINMAIIAGVTGAVTSLFGLLTLVVNRHYQVKEREQARADRIADAAIAKESREKILSTAEKAVKEAQGAKSVAAMGVRKAHEAIETSNGIKRDLMENGVKLIQETPIRVEIENTTDHPVQTHSS